MTNTPPRVLWALVAIFVLGHLPFLAPTLEDIDSVNFALGLHDFDVAKHQPHPPGYPVFIFLARLARPVVSAVLPADAPRTTIDAHALAVWGTLLGGLALLVLARFFQALEQNERRAALATALTACAPLVWFDAARPMSNMAGLALVWVSQGLALSAWRGQPGGPAPHAGLRLLRGSADRMAAPGVATAAVTRGFVCSAVIAGLAAGVRSQTVLSTLPLLLVVIGVAGVWRRREIWFGTGAGLVVGTLAWMVPLLVDTGGPSGYLAAFAAQAGEDLEGVDMLATNPSLRRLALGLVHTFVLPWGGWPLASLLLGLAVFGVVVLAVRDRRALLLLAASCVPYLLFHLWLQETVTTRYALPILPAVAYAAVRGVDELASQLAPLLIGLLIAASLASVVPLQWLYARTGSPVSRAVAAIESEQRQETRETQVPVAMHHAFALALRGTPLASRALPSPPGRETAQVVTHFLEHGPFGQLWFLSDPRRTDLDRIDRTARRVHQRFRWGFSTEAVLGGVRPSDVDLVEVREPGWMVGEGWALTPELAGQAARAGRGLQKESLTAHARSRSGPARLMVGGRNLGGQQGSAVEFSLAIDDRPLETWTLPAEPGFFLKFWDLPAGALASTNAWLPLRVSAKAVDGAPALAAIEQFDLQPPHVVMFGYDDGWYEPEFNPVTGRQWRWASESAALNVRSAGVGVRLRLTGATEFDGTGEPPTVRVRAGERELATVPNAGTVNIDVLVPASTLGLAKGRITVETSRVRIPADLGSSGDRRHLGLRVFSVEIFPLQDR